MRHLVSSSDRGELARVVGRERPGRKTSRKRKFVQVVGSLQPDLYATVFFAAVIGRIGSNRDRRAEASRSVRINFPAVPHKVIGAHGKGAILIGSEKLKLTLNGFDPNTSSVRCMVGIPGLPKNF